MNGWRLLALISVASAVAVSVPAWLWWRSRPTPAERERRRRMAVYHDGRMAEADVIEIGSDTVYYSYSVRGVSYEASQDLSALAEAVGCPGVEALGPATCRYDPRNPANSIVACEEWSGLRPRPRANAS